MFRNSLTREQVEDGYRLVLGRPPESEHTIETQRIRHADFPQFLRSLLESEEFASRRGLTEAEQQSLFLQPINKSFWTGRPQIQYDVNPDVMERLVHRISEQWTRLGEQDPHWSVLTDDRFRADKINAESLAAFNESGRHYASIIAHFEQRTGSPASKGVCLELGCGVGRITRHLAETFESVLALDISPGNLALCRAYLAEAGLTNVQARQIVTLSDFETLPEVDFFYSMIVLQHNSPPIQKAILDVILSKVRPGGGALFQIPTDLIDYEFDAERYLASNDEIMEIHALPRQVIFELLDKHGLKIRDVAADGFIGIYGSETFYAVKPDH